MEAGLYGDGDGFARKVSARDLSRWSDGDMDPLRRIPLKPIRDDARHGEAVAVIAELMGRDVDAGTSDYLDTLILLVNKYEDENHSPSGIDVSPQEASRAISSPSPGTPGEGRGGGLC